MQTSSSILDDIFWVELINVKDNKHSWLQCVIHTGVIIKDTSSIQRLLVGWSSIVGVSLYIRTHEDFGHEHKSRPIGIFFCLVVAVGCFHRKVASLTIQSNGRSAA